MIITIVNMFITVSYIYMCTSYNNYNLCIPWYHCLQTFQNDYDTFVPEVNVTDDPSVIHFFANPFNARFIRIRPQTHKDDTNYPILRFELFGCLRELSSSGTGKRFTTSLCHLPPPPPQSSTIAHPSNINLHVGYHEVQLKGMWHPRLLLRTTVFRRKSSCRILSCQ